MPPIEFETVTRAINDSTEACLRLLGTPSTDTRPLARFPLPHLVSEQMQRVLLSVLERRKEWHGWTDDVSLSVVDT